jgi:replication-associated recombination protein RarA
MEIIGHQHVRDRLRAEVPPVSFFVGPRSVGKWTTAEWVAEDLLKADNILRVKHLNVDTARYVVKALESRGKLAVIIFMGGASKEGQTALLPVLESLGPDAHVIMIADDLMEHVALMSRATIFGFLLLRTAEVEEILKQRGFNDVNAARLAALSGGSVHTALRYHQNRDIKLTVLAVVNCLINRNAKALEMFVGRWSEEHTMALTHMCQEVVSGRFRAFEEAEVGGMERSLALRILTALAKDVRPRLVIHSQLMDIVRGS